MTAGTETKATHTPRAGVKSREKPAMWPRVQNSNINKGMCLFRIEKYYENRVHRNIKIGFGFGNKCLSLHLRVMALYVSVLKCISYVLEYFNYSFGVIKIDLIQLTSMLESHTCAFLKRMIGVK